ncbi:SDR family oxidoreductase [Kineosporia sp. J2-2]|uniref:SDR family oxidoreductase n=1 Tax=Kineosporia corallincola TaxID=2835133 RepID=A0ABS5TDG2_9ACTN|nr:SDR family oxidoreductase [Kineosporia corallincola]MBT0768236.1 SDR family oxidoreductase [Kineosporia corallincola]
MGRFEGKNVVITGGSTGIGLATASLLVNQGARVLISGRDEVALKAACDHLGDGAIAVRGDVSSMIDIGVLADRVQQEFGTIDALIANAGVTVHEPFESTSEESFDLLFAVNAKGLYFTVQRLAPLLADGAGVVLTTSAVNMLGYPMVSAYAASKAAVRSLARSLARELLPRGVRVNAVSPGPIDSGILDRAGIPHVIVEQTKVRMAAEIPMQRLGHPEEVAKAAAFLAFEATFTTGAELVVDGGGTQL